MTMYSFTFVVGDVDPEADDFEDRFFEAGCSDATIALRHGVVVLCFDREADSYVDAVVSAYRDVLNAGASIIRFEPDYLVSASEVAARAGLSRQAISLYERGERGSNYPKPRMRVTSSSPLWDWVEVAQWLFHQGKIDESELRSAYISRIINIDAKDLASAERVKRDVSEVATRPISELELC